MEPELFILLEKLDNKLLIITILILVASTHLIKFFIQVVWPFITKQERYKSVRQLIKDDKALRETRQAEVDEKFKSIETQLDMLTESIVEQGKLSLVHSQGIFENAVFTDGLEPYRRLKALRRLMALKGNGEAKQKGVSIALHNPGDWKKVLSLKMRFKCIDYKYYRSSIEEINKKVLDHGISYEPDDRCMELVEEELNE